MVHRRWSWSRAELYGKAHIPMPLYIHKAPPPTVGLDLADNHLSFNALSFRLPWPVTSRPLHARRARTIAFCFGFYPGTNRSQPTAFSFGLSSSRVTPRIRRDFPPETAFNVPASPVRGERTMGCSFLLWLGLESPLGTLLLL